MVIKCCISKPKQQVTKLTGINPGVSDILVGSAGLNRYKSKKDSKPRQKRLKQPIRIFEKHLNPGVTIYSGQNLLMSKLSYVKLLTNFRKKIDCSRIPEDVYNYKKS